MFDPRLSYLILCESFSSQWTKSEDKFEILQTQQFLKTRVFGQPSHLKFVLRHVRWILTSSPSNLVFWVECLNGQTKPDRFKSARRFEQSGILGGGSPKHMWCAFQKLTLGVLNSRIPERILTGGPHHRTPVTERSLLAIWIPRAGWKCPMAVEKLTCLAHEPPLCFLLWSRTFGRREKTGLNYHQCDLASGAAPLLGTFEFSLRSGCQRL